LNMQGGPNHLQGYCDAHILGDPQNQQITIQPSYYYMGHITRYIPVGSTRVSVGIQGAGVDQLQATAFTTPSGFVVVVVMNRNDYQLAFTLTDPNAAPNQGVNYTIPEHSILTFYYSPLG